MLVYDSFAKEWDVARHFAEALQHYCVDKSGQLAGAADEAAMRVVEYGLTVLLPEISGALKLHDRSVICRLVRRRNIIGQSLSWLVDSTGFFDKKYLKQGILSISIISDVLTATTRNANIVKYLFEDDLPTRCRFAQPRAASQITSCVPNS